METIQMLGSLGEFVGAIAVVATLVYLAIQVRHSREAMEGNTSALAENRQLAIAESYQFRTQMLHEFQMRAADSDELAHISTKFRDGGATALTAVEANRLSALHRATLSRLDNTHFQHQLIVHTRCSLKNDIGPFPKSSGEARRSFSPPPCATHLDSGVVE